MSSKTKVTLFRGGTKQCEVPADKIDIPDLWNVAQTIGNKKKLQNPGLCRDAILNCWHICGALREHILNQPD